MMRLQSRLQQKLVKKLTFDWQAGCHVHGQKKLITALGCSTVSAPVERGLDPAQATFRPSQLEPLATLFTTLRQPSHLKLVILESRGGGSRGEKP